jgi:hypothetical protein
MFQTGDLIRILEALTGKYSSEDTLFRLALSPKKRLIYKNTLIILISFKHILIGTFDRRMECLVVNIGLEC